MIFYELLYSNLWLHSCSYDKVGCFFKGLESLILIKIIQLIYLAGDTSMLATKATMMGPLQIRL